MIRSARGAAPPLRLCLERGGRVARLALAAPPLNILDRAINRALVTAIGRAEKSGAQYLLLESALPGVFSAGVSIPEHRPATVRAMLLAFHAVFLRLHRSPLITLAAVNGHCHGGGAELALFCDFALAGRDARFSFPEIKLGCLPPVASLMLPAKVGETRALELLLTGRALTGAEAAALGLASRSLPGGRGFAAALEKNLDEITGLSAEAQRHARAAARAGDAHREFPRKLRAVERAYLGELMKTRDAAEGIEAFLEKRPPRWTDS